MRARFSSVGFVVLSACLVPNPHLVNESEVGTDSPGDTESDEESSETEESGSSTETGEETAGASCENGQVDGDETDVDCGGSCDPCTPGSGCAVPDDCDSGVCENETCMEPTCSDGVANGTELEVDCGGACRFCPHSMFLEELDDTPTPAVSGTSVMFEDQSFAIGFVDGDGAVRVRWFEENGEPIQPSVVAGESIDHEGGYHHMTSAEALGARQVYVTVTGLSQSSTSDDLYFLVAGPDGQGDVEPIYEGGDQMREASVTSDGSVGVFVWEFADQVFMRRFDPTAGDGGAWIGGAELVNPNFQQRRGRSSTVAAHGGQIYIAWGACPPEPSLLECRVAIRRYGDGWIDPEPVEFDFPISSVSSLKISVSSEGRIGLAWGDSLDEYQVWAAIVDEQLQGAAWELPFSDGVLGIPSASISALSDGTFAVAWPDANTVRIRRFHDPDVPVVAGLQDEAPWAEFDGAAAVLLTGFGNHLLVSWTRIVGASGIVQGQVLSY